MEKTVCFRDFEERDIDFIYKCKNDEKLNSMIVGQWHPFTYEEAAKWVHGCMGEHETYKFWAIATNDDEKRIVGWISLSNIDLVNQKACYHGLVIADKEYNDGFAWIEAYLFIMYYSFEVIGLNRLYGTHLDEHKTSSSSIDLFYWKFEGQERQSIFKNNKYYNQNCVSILRNEYFEHKDAGDYELKKIIRRLYKLLKDKQ